jgi:hypothetical protein
MEQQYNLENSCLYIHIIYIYIYIYIIYLYLYNNICMYICIYIIRSIRAIEQRSNQPRSR